MRTMKLADWCEKRGIKYLTAWRWVKKDQMPVKWFKTATGTILVEVDDDEDDNRNVVTANPHADALSLFLKKTVEFSSSNCSIEDFAAWILSNFTLKIKSTHALGLKPEVKNHLDKFIPKGKKPEQNDSWIVNSEELDKIMANANEHSVQELVNKIHDSDEGIPAVSNVGIMATNLETKDLLMQLSTAVSSGDNLTGVTVTNSVISPQALVYNNSVIPEGDQALNYSYSNYSSTLNKAFSKTNVQNTPITRSIGSITKPTRGRPKKKV